jgi:RNA polymerase sigma-70 factor (ECF subfamily)
MHILAEAFIMVEQKEKVLIERLARSEQRAFNELFDLHHSLLYHYAYRFLRSGDLAEEVVHDAFMIVWEKRQTLDAEKSIKYYLLRICKNLVIDIYHERLRETAVKQNFSLQVSDVDNSTEEDIRFNEYQAFAHAAIEALPPQRQSVYRLCKLEGKSYEEAASQLGISKGTVRDHMLKASKLIRQLLATYPTIITLFVIFRP